MTKISINGEEVAVLAESSLFEAAERMGVLHNTVNDWLKDLAEAWPELFHSAPAQIGTGWGQSVTLEMTLTLNINGEGA